MPPEARHAGVSEREFAQLEAEVRHLRETIERGEDAMRELTQQVADLKSTLQAVRGGWVVLAGLGGVLMAIGGLIVGLIKTFRS